MPGDFGDMSYQLYFNDPQTMVYVTGTVYRWDYGMVQQPVCGPVGTPCEVLNLHAGMCCKEVVWVAESIDGPPTAPSPNTLSSNETLLNKEMGLPSPGNTLDGTQTWCLAGKYRYALLAMPGDFDPLTAGGNPIDGTTATVNVVNPAYFQQYLGPAAPVSGNGPWGGYTTSGKAT